jgi:hypothetical protein
LKFNGVTTVDKGSRIAKVYTAANVQRNPNGNEIVTNLANKLTKWYDKDWSIRKLSHGKSATNTFTEEEIVYAVLKQLT